VVVVCQKCRTRFQLDEARIPAKGVRVRCSKCKHAFFVAPPATEDSTLHRLAEQAAATGRATRAKPGPEVDLPGPGEEEESRFAASAGAAGESEDDWQFNTDTPGEGDGLDAFDDSTPPPAEITDSEPTESGDVESFFELDGLRDPGPDRGNEPAGKPSAKAAPAPAPAPAPREAPKPAPPKPRAKSPIEPEQEVGFEDLGDPESWDFGQEAKRSQAAAPPARAAKPPAPAKAKAKAAARAAAETPEVAPLRTIAPPAPPVGRVGALLNAAAWVLAFALFGFGLRGVLAPGAAVAQFPAAAVGALELGSLRVRHVENFWAGPLVVVSGELRNPGSAAAQAGAAARLSVAGASGVSAEIAAPWFGSELSERELREEDPAALGAALARSARSLALRSLAPGESVPVQAVLAGLAVGDGAFEVEAAPLAALPADTSRGALPAPAVPDAATAEHEDSAAAEAEGGSAGASRAEPAAASAEPADPQPGAPLAEPAAGEPAAQAEAAP
jgi:predicted Zn finger-like uncharacterized protein